MSFPHPGNLGEADAQRTFAGRGAVSLLEADDTGLMLVLNERYPPPWPIRWHRITARSRSLVTSLTASPSSPSPTSDHWRTPCWAGKTSSTNRSARTRTSYRRGRWTKLGETIQHLAADETLTMLHGDLHYRNILRSHREPWLTIDPKGWFGTAAVDAFTVAAGAREQLGIDGGLHAAIKRRVRQFAAAARVNGDLALACCQARAVSSYLYQLTIRSVWFDAEFLKVIALGDDR